MKEKLEEKESAEMLASRFVSIIQENLRQSKKQLLKDSTRQPKGKNPRPTSQL